MKKMGAGSGGKSGLGSIGKSGLGGMKSGASSGKSSGALGSYSKSSHSSTSKNLSSTNNSSASPIGRSSGGSIAKSASPKASKPFDFSSSDTNKSLIPLSPKSYASSSSYNVYGSPKSGKSSTFGIIWIPTGKRNKKKDIVLNYNNDDRRRERSPSFYKLLNPHSYMTINSFDGSLDHSVRPIKVKRAKSFLQAQGRKPTPPKRHSQSDAATKLFGPFFATMQEQETSNFERIRNTWRRLSGERIESALVSMSGDSHDQPHKKDDADLLVQPDRKLPGAIAASETALAANIATPNLEEKQHLIKTDSEEDKDGAGDSKEDDNNDDDKDYLSNETVRHKLPDTTEVDSVYLRPPPPHKARSTVSTPEDDSCGIKCLYYTLQCCDCVLM